ncbi:hypothetical protein D3C73_1510850 [compost metagenome]
MLLDVYSRRFCTAPSLARSEETFLIATSTLARDVVELKPVIPLTVIEPIEIVLVALSLTVIFAPAVILIPLKVVFVMISSI